MSNLNSTISANRTHIGFFGLRNAGKSSVVNAITNQSMSLVSNIKGTTTDPVKKSMEILPIGPVVIVDTPGMDDEGTLGELRIKRTLEVLKTIDMAVLVVDVNVGLQKIDLDLINMFKENKLPYFIVFNKCDLITEEQKQEIEAIYEVSGCKILFVSAKKELGLKELQEILEGKTTTVAGPSGVGKSSLINLLAPEACMETGEISKKIERGRHTTRHAELIQLKGDGYIMDTPGFSSLYLPEMEKEELQDCYPEFAAFEPYCRFQGCSHISEPDCGVKEALSEGKIHPVRYENYCQLYGELKDRKKY